MSLASWHLMGCLLPQMGNKASLRSHLKTIAERMHGAINWKTTSKWRTRMHTSRQTPKQAAHVPCYLLPICWLPLYSHLNKHGGVAFLTHSVLDPVSLREWPSLPSQTLGFIRMVPCLHARHVPLTQPPSSGLDFPFNFQTAIVLET